MAVKVTNYKGEERTLLNPSEKGRKYCEELHTKADTYTGETLSPTQLSYRSGYAKAREDSAKAYCAKNGTKYEKGKKKGSLIAEIKNRFSKPTTSKPKSSKKK